ncbi:MAG: HD domain-containing phosphohydrolase [Solirubrobacterales bacterium]
MKQLFNALIKRLILIKSFLLIVLMCILAYYNYLNLPLIIIIMLIVILCCLDIWQDSKKRRKLLKVRRDFGTDFKDFKMYKEYEIIKELILARSPVGFILLDTQGKITYVNPAIGQILGSTDTVGLNILDFDTVKQSKLYDGILNAFKGVSSEFKNEIYTSYTSRWEKIINIIIYPEFGYKSRNLKGVVIVIQDVSEEYQLKRKIEENYINTIKALADLVDAKDTYTGQHSKMVSKYTGLLCNQLNCLSKEEVDNIVIAAGFHDLGKIGVSDFILNKDGTLTDAEYEIIKKHPVIGADVLSYLNEFGNIGKIIRHHHERWDGNGYPDGIKGDDIPLGSQIIAIADTFDAITSDRIYRKANDKNTAINILIDEKGKQFNPELVDKFIECLED